MNLLLNLNMMVKDIDNLVEKNDWQTCFLNLHMCANTGASRSSRLCPVYFGMDKRTSIHTT